MSGPYLSEDEVSAARARELVEAGAAWLLDVREAFEWESGHAPDAHHIPMGELGERQHELPEDQQILVICAVGGRSHRVTDALLQADYPAANVAGGMLAWQAAGGAVSAPDGPPGPVSDPGRPPGASA
ncbi:rhodanese-like domain-containing protein [Leifsonia shinshuensis]|uniref:Rhodanese-related sulfurtransferase n=1 Tax=Leifsonia shinshuensis TaxID=150026 RepID=A0A853CWX7_9MICO|nr:rhodanese-like domain-containing protein [Leifsonia shinshuensis]NYJ23871.1 rhodanese-related sulfurtransferase [Leifsonia shinshuensis]